MTAEYAISSDRNRAGQSVAGANAPDRPRHRSVAIWLFSVCTMIFLMVVVGGATRLTESGLSMVNWHPVSGIVPPLTDQSWQTEFNAYKQYPEYQKINKGMDLAAFKRIFYWEYGHRLLGRLIGVVFAIPFLYFLIRGRISRKLTPHLAFMFFLGGCQGLLGWYMVKSGLVNRPDVSHYRLTAHLGLALAIYSYIFWVALGLVLSARRAGTPSVKFKGLKAMCVGLTALIALQIAIGGFVAGLNAGFAYNTWPLMGDHFVPDGLFSMSPWFQNFLKNIITIQFSHRMVAYAITGFVVYLWWRLNQTQDSAIRTAGHLLLAAVGLQVFLGIMTLVYIVPVPLGTAHQGGAVLLLTAALYTTRRVFDKCPDNE